MPGLTRTERHKRVGETGEKKKKQSPPLTAAPLPKVPKHLEPEQQLWMPAPRRSRGGDPTSRVTESGAAEAPKSRCGSLRSPEPQIINLLK